MLSKEGAGGRQRPVLMTARRGSRVASPSTSFRLPGNQTVVASGDNDIFVANAGFGQAGVERF
jgi:hypothetical protein